MNLRYRFLFIILGFLLLQVSIFAGFYQLALRPQLNNHDQANAEKNINMGFSFFQYELNQLQANASLWASDIANLKPEFLPEDLNRLNTISLDKFSAEKLNFFILVDTNKQILFSRSYDPHTQKPFPLNNLVKQIYLAKPNLINRANEIYSGFFLTSRGPALIIIHPVLNSHNNLTKYIIIGRLVTEELLSNLSSRSKTQLQMWPLNTDILPEKQKNVLSLIKANETKIHYETQENALLAYKMIPNIDGNPQIILGNTTLRNSFLFINRICKESYGLLLAANFILILMLLKIMNESIIDPIRKISSQLTLAEQNITQLPKVSIKSKDEIGELANKINKVLMKLEYSRNEAMGKAYQAGSQSMRTEMLNDINHLTAPAIKSVDAIEKSLNNLPMNSLEKISAELSNYMEQHQSKTKLPLQLQALNNALRENLKLIRLEAREAHTRVVRIATTLRTHTITLNKPKPFIPKETAIESKKNLDC